MSEELNKQSLFDLFSQSQMTFEEAEKKSKQEAGRPKVERFRIGEDGEYPLRILPLAPVIDEQGRALPLERKGYEYPLYQFFLTINLPSSKGKKSKSLRIPVVRTNNKDFGPGHSVDLIDTYVKIAKEMYDDDDLFEAMSGNSYNNPSSLKWSFQHAMYVLDLSSDKERAKGPQLWQCSQTLYKAIDDAKIRLWKEMRADDSKAGDPVAGISHAYGVKIIRGNNNGKVGYTVEIGRKFVDLTDEEINKLISLPRIPETIYQFDHYSLEAELEFLRQYDELHDIEVCNQPDFKDAVAKLEGELPADDNHHFDLAKAASKDKKDAEVTVETLWNEFDSINDGGYGEKSDEYQNLREKIRQFAEDNELDVRLAHSKTNKQLLEEVEEAYSEKTKQSKAESKSESKKDDDEEERPARHARPSRNDEDVEDDKPSHKEEETEEERSVHRRPRPTLDEEPEEKDSDDADEEPEEKPEHKEEVESESRDDEEERPVHRRRRRV